jgi:hypothetical protein
VSRIPCFLAEISPSGLSGKEFYCISSMSSSDEKRGTISMLYPYERKNLSKIKKSIKYTPCG